MLRTISGLCQEREPIARDLLVIHRWLVLLALEKNPPMEIDGVHVSCIPAHKASIRRLRAVAMRV